MDSQLIYLDTDITRSRGYYYVLKSNPTQGIYCGEDAQVATRLQDILDEAYWYDSVTPCDTCAPVDYKKLAAIRMSAAVEFASSVGVLMAAIVLPTFNQEAA